VDIVIASATEPIIERVAQDTVKEESVFDPINCFLHTGYHSLRNLVVEAFYQIVALKQVTLNNFEALRDIFVACL